MLARGFVRGSRMRRALLVTLILAGVSRAADAPAGFEVRTMQGFTLLVHDEVLRQPADRHQRKPLDVLEREFDDLKRVLKPQHLDLLRQVPVWVRWDAKLPQAPGVAAMYFGGSVDGIVQLGRHPLEQNCIEIVTLKRLGELRPPGAKFQQIITLHEMAHAIQHRLLGFDAAEVKLAFQQAVERRLYDEALDRFGRRGRPYARTNEAEYFAELTCAYLDTCHYYPFNYTDLREHDPKGFALMEAVWRRPEQFAGRAAAVPTPKFTLPVTASKVGAAAEREAFLQVDRARAHLNAGRTVEAKQALDGVLARYGDTLAADDARRLLARLK